MKERLLILCTGNSCRSQMAEGWFRHFHGEWLDVYSAGVETHGVNPKAIQTMSDFGVDISSHQSTHIDTYLGQEFTYILTVCDHAKERCPVFPARALRVHRDFPDPSKMIGSEQEIHEAFHKTCAMIRDFAEERGTLWKAQRDINPGV